MTTEVTNKTKLTISNFLLYYGAAVPISITWLWIGAALSAIVYFDSFGINYLAFASIYSPFDFAVQQLFTVVVILFFPFYLVFFMWGTIKLFPHRSLRIKFAHTLKFLSIFIFMLLVVDFTIGSFGLFAAYSDQKKFNEGSFYPVNVSTNQDGKLECLFQLGSLSEYTVFVNQTKEPILIKTSDINSIKPKAKPKTKSSICPSSTKSTEFDIEAKRSEFNFRLEALTKLIYWIAS